MACSASSGRYTILHDGDIFTHGMQGFADHAFMLARTLPQGVEETIERGLHEVFSSLGRVRFRLENGRLTGTALYRTAETDNDGRTNPDFAEGDPCAVLFVRVVCSFWRLNLT